MSVHVFKKKAVAQYFLSMHEFQGLIPSTGVGGKVRLYTMQKVYKTKILVFQSQLPQNMATLVCGCLLVHGQSPGPTKLKQIFIWTFQEEFAYLRIHLYLLKRENVGGCD